MEEGQGSPGYHFTDEALFAAFADPTPRGVLINVLRKNEKLRNRHFRGHRISDGAPSNQQIVKQSPIGR